MAEPREWPVVIDPLPGIQCDRPQPHTCPGPGCTYPLETPEGLRARRAADQAWLLADEDVVIAKDTATGEGLDTWHF